MPTLIASSHPTPVQTFESSSSTLNKTNMNTFSSPNTEIGTNNAEDSVVTGKATTTIETETSNSTNYLAYIIGIGAFIVVAITATIIIAIIKSREDDSSSCDEEENSATSDITNEIQASLENHDLEIHEIYI